MSAMRMTGCFLAAAVIGLGLSHAASPPAEEKVKQASAALNGNNNEEAAKAQAYTLKAVNKTNRR